MGEVELKVDWARSLGLPIVGWNPKCQASLAPFLFHLPVLMSMRFAPRSLGRAILRPWTLRLAAAAILLLAGACGGLRETVEVRSVPEGAYIYVNGSFSGNTPADLRLKRQIPYRIEFRKVGYRTEEVGVNPQYGDNQKPFVTVGALEGMGAYVELKPNPVEVELIHELVPRAPRRGDQAAYEERLRAVDEALGEGDLTPEESELVRGQLARAFFPEGLPPAES